MSLKCCAALFFCGVLNPLSPTVVFQAHPTLGCPRVPLGGVRSTLWQRVSLSARPLIRGAGSRPLLAASARRMASKLAAAEQPAGPGKGVSVVGKTVTFQGKGSNAGPSHLAASTRATAR